MNVGILGGGQLGRMMALAAHELGLRPVVYAPAEGPATEVAPASIVAPWDDEDALARFAGSVDVATFEIEHLPLAAARHVAARVPMHPSPRALEVAGDRLHEKTFLASLGVPLAPWCAVGGAGDAPRVADEVGVPCVVKCRVQGYDGRGQIRVRERDALDGACGELGVPAVAEAWIDWRREVSTLAARAADGRVVWFDVVENEHRDGILRVSRAPAVVDAASVEVLHGHVLRILEALDYVGVLTVEWFDTADGWVANEIAPRVHNSGHWTIEGARTSQFAQHVRAIAGLPLGDAATVGPSAMVNLIGDMPDRAAMLSVAGAALHDYRKAPRPGRKLGHVTLLADDIGSRDAGLAELQALVDAR